MSGVKKFLSDIHSTDTKVKYKALKNLKVMSENYPLKLYFEIDFFIKLLKHDTNIFRWNAMDIIANLSLVDSKNKVDGIFNEFFGFLDSGVLVTSAHVVDNSWKIANAKPKLCSDITNELLRVTRVKLPTKECRNILVGKTIDSFGNYVDNVGDGDRGRMIGFVREHRDNSRNATRAKAEKFLKKNH